MELDPIILLRMSERDWINAVHELNEKKETNFGDKENFVGEAHSSFSLVFFNILYQERLITTCNINLEALRQLQISEVTSGPKCLPRDHKG